jgi:predicted  nucleic acid-binding Zn-ribbon protein
MLNKEDINKKLSQRLIQLLSEYSSVTNKATFKCLTCNHQWDKRISKILYDDYGCPICKNRIYVNNQSKQEEILERVKNLGLSLIGEYTNLHGTYTFKCLKNESHKHIQRKLINMFDSKKENVDFIPCPDCRIDARIQFLESKCPNLKIVHFERASTATSKYYRIKWQCRHCSHEFNRTDEEALRGGWEGCNDCPNCGYDRRKRLYNKVFDSFEAYKGQVTCDTDWVNKNYTKFLNSDLEHIDHKCSMLNCYTHCIPVWMCCSPVNLRLIPAAENLSKNRKSSITVEQLVLEFSKWILEHPEYAKYINKNNS